MPDAQGVVLRLHVLHLALPLLLIVSCRAGGSAAPPDMADFESDAPEMTPVETDPAAHQAEDAEPVSAPRERAPRPPQTIYRSELVRATSFGPAYLLREVAPEPFRHAGRFVGWEVTQFFPDDPALCSPGCDMQVGDVILSVNGSRLETPQQLSDEFEKIPERAELRVVSLRGETRRRITYKIIEDLDG